MRLFLDTNILTYIAVFEEFLCDGTQVALDSTINMWAYLQGCSPDENLLQEIKALHILYLLDEQAHFDWLFSDVAVEEVLKIRDAMKRETHYDLLDRLIEHRNDIYGITGSHFELNERNKLFANLFPALPKKMHNDALQYCEAILVGAYYFVTNDSNFIKASMLTRSGVIATKTSQLPFVSEVLAEITTNGAN